MGALQLCSIAEFLVFGVPLLLSIFKAHHFCQNSFPGTFDQGCADLSGHLGRPSTCIPLSLPTCEHGLSYFFYGIIIFSIKKFILSIFDFCSVVLIANATAIASQFLVASDRDVSDFVANLFIRHRQAARLSLIKGACHCYSAQLSNYFYN